MNCTACGDKMGQPYEPIALRMLPNLARTVEDPKAHSIMVTSMSQEAMICLKCATKVARVLQNKDPMKVNEAFERLKERK